MKNFIKFGLIGSLMLTSIAMANTLSLDLNAGLAFSQLSNTSAVTPTEGLTNSYHANENTQLGAFISAGPEYIFDHFTSKPWSLGLGASAYFVNLGNISGTETPGSNIGLTDTLDYKMRANSKGVLFEPRLTYIAYHLQPYVLTGMGYAWNTLKDFSETTPAGSSTAPGNPYSDDSQGHFAYEFAAGLQYPFSTQQKTNLLWRLEYRYLNLGNAELGTAAGQTTSAHLTSKNIYTQVIGLGLSYQF